MKIDEIIIRLKRMWRIYVIRPKETGIFLDTKDLSTISKRLSHLKTADQPKQVVINPDRNRAYVTCMKGHKLQEFSYENNTLVLNREWSFDEQCVEVEFCNGLCYITTTNFKRGPEQSSHLIIFDPSKGEIVSSIDTQGEWSKVMAIDLSRKIVFVSNWHSNNISIIDISDIKNPKVIQKVFCDKAPRGLALRPDGAVVATSFYGRKIFVISQINGTYQITQESLVFDPDGYGGNMRDIIISKDGKTVWVTNLGRNIVHWYDAYTLDLQGSILIPREPNSMRFTDQTERIIVVSCRKDDIVCFINTETKKPVGVSEKTEKLPTGLATIKEGFIVTNFDSNSIELHEVRYR